MMTGSNLIPESEFRVVVVNISSWIKQSEQLFSSFDEAWRYMQTFKDFGTEVGLMQLPSGLWLNVYLEQERAPIVW